MNTSETSDLTVIYYTANVLPEDFAMVTRNQLLQSIGDTPVVCVSKKPTDLGYNSTNIVVKSPRSHINIYKQAFIGADEAKTKYIALCEDDVMYSSEHFKYRPSSGRFAYNVGFWGVYTWNPVYSWKGRRNLCMCICERELFLEAMTERFSKYPDDEKIDISIWAEPGKYERKLGVSVQQTEEFWTNPPNIMFSHEMALSYEGLGTRKKLGELRAYDIPYWGHVDDMIKLYRKNKNG